MNHEQIRKLSIVAWLEIMYVNCAPDLPTSETLRIMRDKAQALEHQLIETHRVVKSLRKENTILREELEDANERLISGGGLQ